MNETSLRNVVANNIVHYRKKLNLTQLELAEKLDYSDKAISKWERAEAIPDVTVLKKLSDIFGITIDDLLNDTEKVKPKKPAFYHSRIIITLISTSLVWLLATLVYTIGKILLSNFEYFWLAYIYAIPISLIVLLVFNVLWGKFYLTIVISSLLLWTTALSIYISLNIQNIYLVFIVAIPLQIIFIFWYFLKRYKYTT
jgi:transcriptional regulator with XRE-family HTH domain